MFQVPSNTSKSLKRHGTKRKRNSFVTWVAVTHLGSLAYLSLGLRQNPCGTLLQVKVLLKGESASKKKAVPNPRQKQIAKAASDFSQHSPVTALMTLRR